jgi:hypothetical protein
VLGDGGDESALYSPAAARDEEEEAAIIEDALCPPDDDVEVSLSQLIEMDAQEPIVSCVVCIEF